CARRTVTTVVANFDYW
nr:immunoglobulin heavy chain junction region [Mus musculus]